MKSVFELDYNGRPKDKRFKEFRAVHVPPKDFDLMDEMRDSPSEDKARRLGFFYDKVRNPKADVYHFVCSLQFVLSQRAKDAFASADQLGARIFPISIKGECEPHYLMVITRKGSYFDPKRSVWVHYPPNEYFPEDGGPPTMDFRAFHATKLPMEGLFTDVDDGSRRVCCADDDSLEPSMRFKSIIESHGLEGLKFELLWSEKTGPILPSWDPEPGETWKTGDGRVVRENKAPVPKPKRKAASQPAPIQEEEDPEAETRFVVHQLVFQSDLKLVPEVKSEGAVAKNLVFDGESLGEGWKAPTLEFANGKPKKSDFFPFGQGGFVCSTRGRDNFAPLEDEGEFFLVKIRGLKGKYYFYNSTNCLNCLAPKKTQWKKGVPKGTRGSVERPVFIPERLDDDVWLFKIAEDGGTNLYCVEETGDYLDGELKALVKEHRLKGLTFKKVFEAEK